jgi:hypothetical protein
MPSTAIGATPMMSPLCSEFKSSLLSWRLYGGLFYPPVRLGAVTTPAHCAYIMVLVSGSARYPLADFTPTCANSVLSARLPEAHRLPVSCLDESSVIFTYGREPTWKRLTLCLSKKKLCSQWELPLTCHDRVALKAYINAGRCILIAGSSHAPRVADWLEAVGHFVDSKIPRVGGAWSERRPRNSPRLISA